MTSQIYTNLTKCINCIWMYLAFSCPTVSSTSLLINPACGYLTCPVPKSQDSTASPRIAGSNHSKGHQRLCSLLTLTARQTMTNKGTWESAYISLWTSIPFPEALRSFSEPRPTFFPKTHVDTCCILETSRWSTLTWGQAEAKHIPGKIIGQEIKSTCSMCWSCGVRTQSEEKRSWDPWPCLVIHNHLCLCRYRSHPWNLHSKQLSKDVGIQIEHSRILLQSMIKLHISTILLATFSINFHIL